MPWLDQFIGFTHNIIQIAAAGRTTCLRNDAKTADKITTILNFYICPCEAIIQSVTIYHKFTTADFRWMDNQRLILFFQSVEIVRNIQFMFIADNQIHTGNLTDSIDSHLSITSDNSDKSIGIFPQNFTDRLPAFCISLFGNRTGIDHG